jgi:hypothetical protein
MFFCCRKYHFIDRQCSASVVVQTQPVWLTRTDLLLFHSVDGGFGNVTRLVSQPQQERRWVIAIGDDGEEQLFCNRVVEDVDTVDM